jgi:hypothetical protein
MESRDIRLHPLFGCSSFTRNSHLKGQVGRFGYMDAGGFNELIQQVENMERWGNARAK